MVSRNTVTLLALKLDLSEDGNVLNKAAEFLRLLNTKSTAGSNMTDTSKVVICLDLAATMYNSDLDHKLAIKYSGLKAPSYANCKKIVENLLEINNDKISISTLCLTLQCSGAQALAEKILDEYQRCSKTEIDMNLPQYVCMAVYQACRVNKIKVAKSKIIEKSRLKSSQWTKMDAEWTKFVTEKFPNKKKTQEKTKEHKSFDKDDEKVMEIDAAPVKEEKSLEPKVEPYEDWKKRILNEAYKEIRELEKKEKLAKTEAHIEMSPRRSPRKTPQKYSPYKCPKSPRKDGGIRLLFPKDL